MVCVFPDDVWPYAKIVPLYPSKTSESQHRLYGLKKKKKVFYHGFISLILTDWQTFNNPLGAGVVHLLLCCIWLQNSIKHVRFSLEKTNKKKRTLEGDCVCAGHHLQPLHLQTLHQEVIRKSNLPSVNISEQERPTGTKSTSELTLTAREGLRIAGWASKKNLSFVACVINIII